MRNLWPALAVIAGIAIVGAVLGRASCARTDTRLISAGIKQTDKDPGLAAAVLRAKHSLGSFVKEFKSPKVGDKGFGVQASVDTPKGPEHIWIHLDKVQGDNFTGRLADEPYNMPGQHKGDVMTVTREQVSDWIYLSKNGKVGGFTIDALQGG